MQLLKSYEVLQQRNTNANFKNLTIVKKLFSSKKIMLQNIIFYF